MMVGMEFDFVVRNAGGTSIKGRREAENRDELMRLFKNQNLSVVSLKPVKTGLNGEIKLPFGNSVSPKAVTLMARQMSTLVMAGVSLTGALDLLRKTSAPPLAAVLRTVQSRVESGTPLSTAMGEHPKVFDDFFVKLTYAGEESGSLDVVLGRIAQSKEKQMALAGKIKSAMTYPIAVLVIAMLITYFLLTNIVPQFASMLSDSGAALPPLTNFLIMVSTFLQTKAWILGLLIAVLVQAWRLAWRNPALRRKMELGLFKLPILGKIRRLAATSIFARTTQTLLSSGVNISEALIIARDATGSLVIGDVVDGARHMVMIGESMSTSLRTSPLIEPTLVAMVEVGESTGKIDDMLARVADIYDNEVDTMVETMSSLIEPIMIVFLGGIVGTIVAGMFMPMFALMNTLNG